MDKRRWEIAVKTVCVAVLAALYLMWAFDGRMSGILEVLAAALSVALFGWLGVRALSAWFTPPVKALKVRYEPNWRELVYLALALLGARIAEYIIVYGAVTAIQGYNGSIFARMREFWIHSDSNSYLGIADNWYVTEGDPRFHIVFLPFYPIVIGAVKLIVSNTFASSLIVNTASSLGAGIMLYKLALMDYDRETALRAVRYQFLLAGAIFLLAPMTEALFLLLSVSAVYLARRKKPLFAALLAALAAFTRSPGVLLLVPLAIETFSGKQKLPLWQRIACLIIVPLGTLAYLAVNYSVTGDALTFMTYQREHWYQGFGWFWNAAWTQTGNLVQRVNEGNAAMVLSLWVPNITAFFGALAVMTAAVKRIRHSYSVYFVAYFAVTLGVTWLLSAPRYMFGAFPLAIGLASLVKKPWLDSLVTAALILGLIAYGYMFATGLFVY